VHSLSGRGRTDQQEPARVCRSSQSPCKHFVTFGKGGKRRSHRFETAEDLEFPKVIGVAYEMVVPPYAFDALPELCRLSQSDRPLLRPAVVACS
jgi:hypothetical protein